MSTKTGTYVCAVIVAAGGSTRMGGKISKQLMPLSGKPAISYTLRAFQYADRIDEIVLVCRQEDCAALEQIAERYRITKIKSMTPGGATRQQSVARGVAAASEAATHIAIHDGARALILPEDIDRAVEDAIIWKASTLAVPVKDTIKMADTRGVVTGTLDRSTLWSVQTPQVFERTLYLKALRRAEDEGKDYTDDCQLVERCGAMVHLCMGSYENSKLTTVDDLAVAEQTIKRREENRL